MNEYLVAIIIGIVEGLTEYLPISSTGHMIIVGHFLNFTGEKSETFEIFIQLGAILAVFILYIKRFIALLDFKTKDNFSGVNGLLKIAACCMPVSVLGLIFHKKIKLLLFNPTSVSIALIVGGIIILIVERKKINFSVMKLEDITLKNAFLIGIFQCFALIPGASRSGSMIIGGMLLGLSRTVAAEFSFIIAVPIMVLATTLDLLKSYKILDLNDAVVFGIGFITAFITAYFSVNFFINILKKTDLAFFGYYRIILGLILYFVLL
ncbi:MAG: undecaprenyl-diphosphate phosphatase [Proteobacteria bacterium]|nr:undecaprenyl-diphosphate phosphatase [Pseudomonadota bacterium]